MRDKLKNIGDTVFNWIEYFVFASRYITLLPLAVGIVFATLLYEYHFILELWNSHDFGLLFLLGLLDAYMVLNLAYTINAGSLVIFVREPKSVEKTPRVLKFLTSGSLKVKLSTSLIGITGVHLLKDFLETHDIKEKLIIHGVFLISALVVCAVNYFSHAPHDKHDDDEKPKTLIEVKH